MDVTFEVASISDRGLHRRNNEDYAGHFVPTDAAGLSQSGALFAVADGVGGSPAGEVASSEAVNVLLQEYFFQASNRGPAKRFREAVERAAAHVFSLGSSHRRLAGMQTTLTAVLVWEGTYFVAHVGDSKAYQIRGRRARALTADHAVGHMLTRSIGLSPIVQSDFTSGQIEDGDVFALFTDGLVEDLTKSEICRRLAGAGDLALAARELVEEAKRRGGQDNLTLTAFRVAGLPSRLSPERANLYPSLASRALSSIYPVRNQAALSERLNTERSSQSGWEEV